ncbi:MAG: GDYXXLXY domain-containing protein [Neomegalonema sp.]|nr:GDYXXLXY domain-containing protein [Neomegalonema sp.]
MSWLKSPFPWIAGALLLALGQTAALGAMLWERIAILRSDTVITLKARPVDPRDIFRGDYVILNYAISRHSVMAISDAKPERPRIKRRAAPRPSQRPWVILVKKESDWAVAKIQAKRPSALPKDSVALRATYVGRFQRRHAATETTPARVETIHNIQFGLERFYVPEGVGRELETKIGAARVTVDIAIAPDGDAGVKALRVDGKVFLSEPWF